ncbi:hypothetical protein I7I48_07089 [Histoplasma ohiense]|nr:hypothetical protein I7I48_07089 [Histoplasma ohiense (nom. inval.)]
MLGSCPSSPPSTVPLAACSYSESLIYSPSSFASSMNMISVSLSLFFQMIPISFFDDNPLVVRPAFTVVIGCLSNSVTLKKSFP